MALLDIHLLGDPGLRVPAKPTPAVTDAVRRLADDMFETMHAAKGIGLAAPQVGRRERLAVIDVDDRPFAILNPEIVLRELLALGRDPFFVVAEVEKQSVYVGEPVVITWAMYNAATVHDWQVVHVPKLSDFWSEELTRKTSAERAYLGDVMVQRGTIHNWINRGTAPACSRSS